MLRTTVPLVGLLLAGPALAEDPARDPLDLSTAPVVADDAVLSRVFPPRPAPEVRPAGTFMDGVLERLGIDKDRLVEALSEVELTGAEDNWRDEQSGEVGLSFDITDKLSVGPSLGLSWEQEHSGSFREEWSHQLKLGLRYHF